jgi:hypothetical protein
MVKSKMAKGQAIQWSKVKRQKDKQYNGQKWNGKRTSNTMVKSKMTKGQTIVKVQRPKHKQWSTKYYTENWRSSKTNHTNNWGWTHDRNHKLWKSWSTERYRIQMQLMLECSILNEWPIYNMLQYVSAVWFPIGSNQRHSIEKILILKDP